MHHIEQNRALGFIEVTVSGFWDEAHFENFVRELRQVITAFSDSGRMPMTLYNYTDASIQSQTVVSRMRKLALHPSMVDRRVALYTEGVLARQQAKRVAEGRDNMRVFDSRDDAVAFLLGTEARETENETALTMRKAASG